MSLLNNGVIKLTTNDKIVSSKCKCSLCNGWKAPNTVKRYSLTDKYYESWGVKLCAKCAKQIKGEIK